ncbi:glycoside hydrolase family 76 protein [Mucilaginibacter sp.]|uniref:glycoside hydrolase family 76 protein n=1 Tax=Mucilaginibacter sp. TaxID=1882438 RepID=UPI000CB1C8E5|nr:glycoside hydrolase family 76 protein [Mucilaginibacter sp.]PLW90138.1 MAG: hydrolase [Mucilaginibacter sp.]HEK19589.1 hydrolase [Bacteroidota bacterium]
MMMNKRIYLSLAAAILPLVTLAQPNAAEYKKRAESIYRLVWSHYRVAKYNGLFLENYPSGRSDSLNYFQGESVKEKEVSFLWPFSGVFTSTNILMRVPGLKAKYKPYQDSLVTGIEQYRDTLRQPPGYQAYPVRFEKADRYYDDNGLVGIDYMESYFNTHNPLYLKRAKEVFKFILSGWNNDAGGGVTWLEGHNDQKPACSNGMATLTALKIYEGSKEHYYLEQGKRFYNWMYNILRDSTTGIISNDVKLDGKQNRIFWTYNTGSLIEAAVLLYKFTGEAKYLAQAKQLAASSYSYYSKLPHSKELKLHIDVPWFVTVLFRGYEALYKIDHNYQYIAAIEHDLNYAWQNSRDKYGFITKSWLPDTKQLAKPKWLLDEACIAELYARLYMLKTIK